MAEGTSPDGGPAMYITLSNLGPYFSSSSFLSDMVTGYVFVLHRRRWVRTDLTCTQAQTPPEELGSKIQEASNTYWNKLIANNKTSLQRVTSKNLRKNGLNQTTQVPVPQPMIAAQPPPLPRIDNPELYTIHEELMPLCIRTTYIRDRTRNAHTYILEYSATMEMEKCQKSFDNLRELLTKYPILWYPDINKDYTLFIDASKFGYAGVLTQEYEDNSVIKHHPVC